MCKPLGVSLHAVSNGAPPPPAVLPAAAVLPAYSTLPLMPGFLGAPHPAAGAPSAVTHTHTAAPDWNTYYYVSKTAAESAYYSFFSDFSAASSGIVIFLIIIVGAKAISGHDTLVCSGNELVTLGNTTFCHVFGWILTQKRQTCKHLTAVVDM